MKRPLVQGKSSSFVALQEQINEEPDSEADEENIKEDLRASRTSKTFTFSEPSSSGNSVSRSCEAESKGGESKLGEKVAFNNEMKNLLLTTKSVDSAETFLEGAQDKEMHEQKRGSRKDYKLKAAPSANTKT